MKPNAYIRRKDNHLITAVVVYLIGQDKMLVAGPYRRMRERLFYQRWPTAPRGCFYVELSDDQARVYSDLTGRLTAKFTALES